MTLFEHGHYNIRSMKRREKVTLVLVCIAICGCSALAQNFPVQKAIVIAIPADGQFYIEKNEVPRGSIPEKVKELYKDGPIEELVVYIKPACQVMYGTVVSVIASLRDAGINKVGIVAEKSSGLGTKANDLNNVQLNTRSSKPLESTPLVVDVKSKGVASLDGKSVSMARLQITLRKKLQARNDKTVYINAPDQMTFCEVGKVVDIAKQAGGVPIDLNVK